MSELSCKFDSTGRIGFHRRAEPAQQSLRHHIHHQRFRPRRSRPYGRAWTNGSVGVQWYAWLGQSYVHLGWQFTSGRNVLPSPRGERYTTDEEGYYREVISKIPLTLNPSPARRGIFYFA